MKYKTIIFDFDSTLVTIEGVDELARMKGVFDQVSVLTDQAMSGKVSFEDVFTKRLEIINPTAEDLIRLGVLYQQNLVEGVEELIKHLLNDQLKVMVISGGYLQAILPTTNHLGIPDSNVFAIELLSHNHTLTRPGKNSILSRNSGKYNLLRDTSFENPAAFVGDGITDVYAKSLVDSFIGFGGVCYRPKVEELSDHYISSSDISTVYNYLKL